MRNKEIGSFLLAAKRLMHEIEYVLESNEVQWERACFDMQPYIPAMLRLCEQQDHDVHPVHHLRHAARMLKALRGPVDPAELKAAEESALQYEQWLSSTFPRAFAEMRRKASEHARKHALN
jgi:hypothetical protein